MIPHALRSIARAGLTGFSLIATMLALAFPARGVGLPPMPDTNDTNAMEQYRIKVFYEAQKSQEEKLKVGQQRYDMMLTNRLKVQAAMAAELAEREKQVVLQPEPTAESNAGNQESNTWVVTTVGAALIGLGFLGFRYYLSRLDLRDAASQKRSKPFQI
jgi:hypothetical protein